MTEDSPCVETTAGEKKMFTHPVSAVAAQLTIKHCREPHFRRPRNIQQTKFMYLTDFDLPPRSESLNRDHVLWCTNVLIIHTRRPKMAALMVKSEQNFINEI